MNQGYRGTIVCLNVNVVKLLELKRRVFEHIKQTINRAVCGIAQRIFFNFDAAALDFKGQATELIQFAMQIHLVGIQRGVAQIPIKRLG